MAASKTINTSSLKQLEDEFKQLELSLPKQIWFGSLLHHYQGFWCLDLIFEATIAFQTHFQAHDDDIILASLPKTGTTWSKALLYAILNRKNLSVITENTLYRKNPHELVPFFELSIYKKITGNQPDFTEMPSPRLFATHLPYSSLSESIKSSKCRMVYICRNPLDTFMSSWHFSFQFQESKGIDSDNKKMEEHFAMFCKGIYPFGPYDKHVLGYWKESIQHPERVLFLEYEGLKKEPKVHVKRLAEFVGCPFSEEEERDNVIEEIIKVCNLKRLKEMEVNKTGKFCLTKEDGSGIVVENKTLFRKGEVGDWTNYLTPSMVKQFEETLLEKLKKDGFSQSYYQASI